MNKETQDQLIKMKEQLLELTTIIKDVVSSLALEEPKVLTKWRAEKNGQYWFLNDYGEVIPDVEENAHMDSYRYLTGNYYKTEEEAEKALELQLAKGRLSHAYYGLVGDWKPDWLESVCTITYDFTNNRFHSILTGNILGNNYFYFKDVDLTNQFIRENEKDLKIVFNINDND